ncbi:YgdI/YgdR family lipoprotein [Vibrio sp. Of14-4]|uniref:YgdI/YgdR family lipoprotein n=1 Tax=Vibrio sp. Of14-4 TaxID=2724878 RepID=UPI001EF289FB|nr:YgdI/YgdR family lipoprotein [Vibrio sp. Of14-4]MCG7490119.1 YgdI/YgdR family lipoprotein [Vibrio sp. Of14-4]
MFKTTIVTAFSLVILAGCASPQQIVLKDGTTLDTPDEVSYNEDTGFYEYEDVAGKTQTINKNEVLKVNDL